MLRNCPSMLDYLKDLILALMWLLNQIICLALCGFYMFSFGRILDLMLPKLLIPWWGVGFFLFQIWLMYYYRYSEERIKLMIIFSLVAIVNYTITIIYNPLLPMS